jgi:hypothetical protein
MGAAVFLILFVLGFILSTAGGIIGLVEAFRVNTTWGLLYLFVPFAALVFIIKFWSRKWTRNGFLLWLGGLASILVSVPFLGGFISQQIARFEEEGLEDIQIESIPAEEEPLAGQTQTDAEQPPDVDFVEPIVPAAPQLSAIARAELIQSTDPDERVQQINSSRPDPFATVPIPPKPQVAPPPPAPGGGGATAGGGTAGGGTATATAPQPTAPGGGGGATGQPGGGTAPSPGGPGSIGLPPIDPFPSLPQPTLAQGVQVSGVVRIGDENFAIVQAPTDATSQYVKAGQRLANGQVLVKRIEVRGSDPVVVLEQNGIEVSRPVLSGDPEEGPTPADTTAQFPGPVPSI